MARPNFSVNGAEISHWCFLCMSAKTQAFFQMLKQHKESRQRQEAVLRGHDMTEFNLRKSCVANRDVILWRTDKKSVPLTLHPKGVECELTGLSLLEQKGRTVVRGGNRLHKEQEPSHTLIPIASFWKGDGSLNAAFGMASGRICACQ